MSRRVASPLDEYLLKAAADGDVVKIKEYLKDSDVNLNVQDATGMTALHWATRKGYSSVVAALCEQKGLEADLTDKYGFTPLHWACCKGDLAAVQLLVARDVSLNVLDDELGFSPLHWAVSKAQEAVIPALGEAGANMNMTCAKGLTPLLWACQKGRERLARALIAAGADPYMCDERGVTPLHLATLKGSTSLTQLLIDAGSDVNARATNMSTALIQAAGEGNEAVVLLLLKHKADATAENSTGYNALHFASKLGHDKLLIPLIQAGADVNKKTYEGVTPLHFACYHGHFTAVQALLDQGADPLITNNNKSGALHVAASEGHEKICSILLKRGSVLSSLNEAGEAAVHVAAKGKREKALIYLVKKGADAGLPNKAGENAIQMYANLHTGNAKMLEFLYRATPNAKAMAASSVSTPQRAPPCLPEGAVAAAVVPPPIEEPAPAPAPPPEAPSAWEIEYEELSFEKIIGKGSYGEVYKGSWRGTAVAIKQFTVRAMNEKNLALFHAEVNILSRLRHPNIVLFMGACLRGPDPLCIVTEFVTGGSLFHALHDRSRSLNWEQQLKIAMDISCGVNYLHCSNPVIMHRDLKSLNCLVDENWGCKVCDFGLTKIKQQAWAQTRCGTPHYMAPQILTRGEYDERADVYAMGIILWEIMSRKEPYSHLKAREVGKKVLAGMRPIIPKTCPDPMRKLMQACWQEEIQMRPSFGEIINVLTQMQDQLKEYGRGR